MKILNELEDLFKHNHAIEGLIRNIQLKKDTKLIPQNGRPVPIHFQNSVRHELEKLVEKQMERQKIVPFHRSA